MILPKRVSELQKKQISESFINGEEISKLSETYNLSKQTIIKQLRNILGDEQFNEISYQRSAKSVLKNDNLNFNKKTPRNNKAESHNIFQIKENNYNLSEKEMTNEDFFEIPPVTTNINLDIQKDLTSKPLSEANFPNVLYMGVDKNIELEPKLLKDFPEWRFLSENDLNRKTIQVFSDQKLAKQSCAKNQKLIKVTNTKVFLIASENLKSKGISRIIFGDSLLAL